MVHMFSLYLHVQKTMEELINLYHLTLNSIPEAREDPLESLIEHNSLQLDLGIDKATLTIPHHAQIPTPLSPRKTHELSQLIPYIQTLILDNDIEFIIDIGSGNSYLSRLLSMKTQTHVICVEKVKAKQATSRRLDEVYGKSDILYLSNLDQLKQEETKRYVKSRQLSNDKRPRALMIGLDACGDLTSDILDLIKEDPLPMELIGCCVVSCCFHKVTRLLTFHDDEIIRGLKECSEQDLRALSNHEILIKYESDMTSSCFEEWIYKKGILSQILECIVHQDRVDYLPDFTSKLDIIFDFDISSRNVLITKLKTYYESLA